MLINSDHPISTSVAAVAPVSAACVNCGAEERRLLHHVRHRGIFRRLCTTCVLRLHPQSFCPTCFQVYPPPPSNDSVVTCFKCYSASHSPCVAAPPPNPYICPLCSNPNVPLFKLKTASEANIEVGEGEDLKVMDRDAAKKLLAAAKIAASSMNKAAVALKAEAERRAKEAAFARKRAKEALEHVAYLVVKEKRKKETALGAPNDVSGSGVRGGGSVVALVKAEKNVNVVNIGNGNGTLGNNVGQSEVEEKIRAMECEDRVENSNQVLAALNAVELRENEKTSGTTVISTELGIPVNDDCVSVMDVDESGTTRASFGASDEGLIVERSNIGDIEHAAIPDMDSGIENFNEQDLNNEVTYVQPTMDQMQYKDNSIGEEQHANGGASN